MRGLIESLLALDARMPMFRSKSSWICAGQIRATAASAMARMAPHGEVFLHTSSAACFVAGILAAAALDRRVLLPAHAQSAYLAEIGCAPADLWGDGMLGLREEGDCPDLAPDLAFAGMKHDCALAFFTSGSTGAVKRVETRLSCLEMQARTLDQLWGAQVGHVRGTVSHQHIYGLLFRVLWPILSGRTADDAMALYWEDILSPDCPPGTLISSPAHLTRLPAGEGRLANAPAMVFSSGQALPYAAAQACGLALGSLPIEVLGSTETGGIAWRCQSAPATPWTPLPDVRVSAASDGALAVESAANFEAGPVETGDAIALLADGRFHLRPRGDRIEKIDGKRVSLARIERILGELAQVATCAVLTLPNRQHSLAAIVTLTPAGAAQLAAIGAFQLSRALRAACADQLEPAERPKHWRFLDAIPMDTQGKLVLSTLRALFEPADPLAPLVMEISHSGPLEAEISFRLPPDLLYFQGHFPTRAILPGIAQVHIAALLARRLWGIELPNADLTRVKFRHVLQPHDQVRLTLRHDDAKQRLIFRFYLGAIEASLGEIGGGS